jgi:hypothetical protein
MVGEEISEAITTALGDAIQTIISVLPRIIGAIIVLIIGYLIGKFLGGLVRKLLEKTSVDNKLIKGTMIERVLKAGNMTFEKLMGALVSIFFYVIFILAAIDILDIEMLSSFVNQVLLYLPNLIAGILVLVIGLIAVEWITKFIKSTTKEYKVISADLVTMFIRAILILVIIVITLDQWKIDTSIIYTFIQPLAWGVAAAIAVAFGWGFKDVVADWSKNKAAEWDKQKK